MKKIITGILCLLSAVSYAAEMEPYSCKATVVNYTVKNGSRRVSAVVSEVLKMQDHEKSSSSVHLGPFIFSVVEPDSSNRSVIKLSIYDKRDTNLLLISDVVASRPTDEIEVSVVADVDKGLIRVSFECLPL